MRISCFSAFAVVTLAQSTGSNASDVIRFFILEVWVSSASCFSVLAVVRPAR